MYQIMMEYIVFLKRNQLLKTVTCSSHLNSLKKMTSLDVMEQREVCDNSMDSTRENTKQTLKMHDDANNVKSYLHICYKM